MLYIYYNNNVFVELANNLKSIFPNSHLINNINPSLEYSFDDDLYIMFGMNDYTEDIIPKNYIVYQLEQTTAQDESKWFSERYLTYLKNSIEIYDYSYLNFDYFISKGEDYNISLKPFGFIKKEKSISLMLNNKKEFDVLFIGSLNDRRNKILNELKKTLKVHICTNTFSDDEIINLLSKSKVLLNIHYYDKSILETVRLSSILNKIINNSLDTKILTEYSLDTYLDNTYNFLDFCRYDDIIENTKDLVLSSDDYIHYYESFRDFDYNRSFTDFNDKYSKFLQNKDIDMENEIPEHVPKDNIIKIINHKMLSSDMIKFKKYPMISIITITYNRKSYFKLPIRNYINSTYPKDRMEWIIVDDSEDEDLSDILPNDKSIKYLKLKTTGRLSIGQKRNFGVKKALGNYIVFMDDDDYYYDDSFINRINILLRYPEYDLVGVNMLHIHDMISDSSLMVNGSTISEASMAFKKSFFDEKNFKEEHNTLGEGYLFTKNRLNKCICIPSEYVLIAITHGKNYTGKNRSGTSSINLLDNLDNKIKLMIYKIFDQEEL